MAKAFYLVDSQNWFENGSRHGILQAFGQGQDKVSSRLFIWQTPSLQDYVHTFMYDPLRDRSCFAFYATLYLNGMNESHPIEPGAVFKV